ncbi:C-C motif chemokine 12 [Parambassis ranga]|uniref:C-C motif chemokine 12 n=1 Tax=Parambassis ranga TaxID=210632 RepID=A0A6P7K3W3_9TELE|nr:C-C motif chemokine 12-like [Parambassis ranga]
MAKLALCVSTLLVLLVVLTESSPVKFCCTKYQEKHIPQKALKDYRIQDINFCNIEAVIFKTVKDLFFCGNPDEEWVKKAMEYIDQKK